ncbi:PilN domain-containing protein [Armatimonas rosea]|uniref:Tfp pilus assembly protein PilN n=1 Tax=Armatimonas rosea TaxID=685828 RepID=A0A7W9SMC9_ARMRO|nr:PilN domain-containing protein [Armatimonas rosea]MBB6049302.1 Tfp pilus assembly protein PilN [Armatimonas rosea]
MPNINLILERRQEKRRMETLSRNLFFTLGGSLAVFVAIGSYLVTERFTLQGDVDEAERKMEKLKPILADIDRIKKETADKQPKVDTLEKARYDTLRWTMLFQSVAESLPKDVWLTNMGAAEGDPLVVSLAGSAPSQSKASDLALNLRKQVLFEKVELLSTSRIEGANHVEKDSRFVFQITAPIKQVVMPTAAPAGPNKTAQSTETSTGGNSRV